MASPTPRKRSPRGGWNIRTEFASVRELVQFVRDTPATVCPPEDYRGDGGRQSMAEKRRDFNYSDSLDAACELALEGWRDPIGPMLDVVDTLRDEVREMTRDQFVGRFDVSGAEVDIDRYLSGQPECMVDYLLAPIPEQGKVIRVLVNGVCPWTVTPDRIIKRGAAVLALIEAILLAGGNVELFVAFPTTTSDKHYSCEVVCLKDAAQRVDVEDFAYAIANPDMLRRLVFAVRETYEWAARERMGFGGSLGGYGIPTSVARENEITNATVVIEKPSGYADRMESDPIEWVRSTLTGIGLLKDA